MKSLFKEANGVGAIIINSKNEVLLQKRTFDYRKGVWNLFGGTKEKNESSERAIFRELEEELGFNKSICPIWHSRIHHKKDTTDIFVLFTDKEVEDITLTEGAGFAFFDEKELKNLNLSESSRIILDKFYNEEVEDDVVD